ncbi:MAG: T9SS type A sorting domain-containing protein [Candidatus Eisenbacteria bacterium]|nr:T9SS type A sorting domain-containing protein [Candidatus Latescibacterota bacterium]MBD3302348.1 T9SS type A sorting domain-containing protein [Candidatus Eisenbacteria bacterium]
MTRFPASIAFSLLLLGLLAPIGPAAADLLPTGIEILAPETVMSERSRVDSDGTLYLLDAEGVLRRFVISTADSVISNPGSGEFHPLEEDRVRAALQAIDPRFLSQLGFTIYLLPYPVASPLNSWAGERTIYLSPGVYAMSEVQLHQLVAHEVGHILHRYFLPDDDHDGWSEYRWLRGIQDTTVFHDGAIHKNRPHEVFAEDFRVLFGGERARADGSIENPDLLRPDRVPDLEAFFFGLIDLDLVETIPDAPILAPRVFPNPIAAATTLRIALPHTAEPARIVVHDVSGRVVRDFGEVRRSTDGLFEISWNGKDRLGRTLPRGVYFLRTRGGSVSARLQVIG